MSEQTRCPWSESDPLLQVYHDCEWGVWRSDDRHQFEHLCLECFQAGLSWLTVLRKRENFRKAFHNFEPAKVARMTGRDVERLMGDAGIIRNRRKIEAVIHSAGLFLQIGREFGGFASYLLQFAPKRPHRFTNQKQIPATTPEAEAMAKDIKKRGFKFLGPTTLYAHMQSVGLVNDHIVTCFRYDMCGRQ